MYSSKSFAAITIANNADLLTEILVRLPAKSLLKFKLVSKHWKSLISSPQFCCRHYSVSGLILYNNYSLVTPTYDFVPLKNNPTSTPFKSLVLADNSSGLRIWQSCHGLMLCSRFGNAIFRHEYFLYNPTTEQFVTIPQPGVETSRVFCGMSLAYDPAKSSHYKLVCVSYFDSSKSSWNSRVSYQIEVYSSQTGTWRLSGDPLVTSSNQQEHFKMGVFWNGAIHWINCYNTSIYFNVDEEQLRKMPMPPPLHQYSDDEEDQYTDDEEEWTEADIHKRVEKRRDFNYFGQSREHLHLVAKDIGTEKFDVYEMERDYSSWYVKYHVDLDGIIFTFPELIRDYRFMILSIVREANEGESHMVLHIPGKVIRYNLTDKTFTNICDFAQPPESTTLFKYGWRDAYQYVETLARF